MTNTALLNTTAEALQLLREDKTAEAYRLIDSIYTAAVKSLSLTPSQIKKKQRARPACPRRRPARAARFPNAIQ